MFVKNVGPILFALFLISCAPKIPDHGVRLTLVFDKELIRGMIKAEGLEQFTGAADGDCF